MYSIYAGDELLYSDVFPLETRKVTSPTLKMAVDEAGSLEFTVSEVNKCYTKLKRMKTIVTVKKLNANTKTEEPIWDGRILREDRDFYKNKRLYVEGALAFLNDTCQPLKEYANKNLEELVTAILTEHNTIVNDPGRSLYWGGIGGSFKPPEIEYWSTQYEYTIDTIRNIAEYLECHFVLRKDPETGRNGIWFFKDDCGFSEQSIVFTKNLMDYTENYDLSKLATVLLPLCQTDRESADKPVNVGTTIDLTTPKPCDEDGWGVFCPLSEGWVQEYSKDTAELSVSKGVDYSYAGGNFNDAKYNSFHIVVDPTGITVGDVASDGSVDTTVTGRLVTGLIELGDSTPVDHPYVNSSSGCDSYHAYQLVIEDSENIHNLADSIKVFLYYRPRNSSDTWQPLLKDGSTCSGWGLYNEDSAVRWPNLWGQTPTGYSQPRLAFEVYESASPYETHIPDTVNNSWAMRISFALPGTASPTRVKFFKLFAMYGVSNYATGPSHGGEWVNEQNTYRHDMKDHVYSATDTGLYSRNILNLMRDGIMPGTENQEYYAKPWAYSKYPLCSWSYDTSSWNIFVNHSDNIFDGNVDVRNATHGGQKDITDIDLNRFTRYPVENVADKTLSDLQLTNIASFGDLLNSLQRLNYGWLKYHPTPLTSNSVPRIAVLEIDLDKYSGYFLTSSNTDPMVSGNSMCVASVWKIKDDPNLDDWIPLKGRDDDADTGFEYHFISKTTVNGKTVLTPEFSISSNRSGSESRMTHEDLEADDPPTKYVLNPNKYEFESADYVTRRCFEKEMHFYYTPEPGYSKHILLCLYSCEANLSVTLATDEELYSILAVGQDPNGIDKSKETPMRHSTEEPHSYIYPDKVYDEKLGYGIIVPSTDEHRLPNLSEMTAMTSPFPNVYEEGGYYGAHVEEPFEFDAHAGNNIVIKTNPADQNFNVCVFFVKPSYVDEEGKLCTRSIYISTTMHGKSGTYAIFELSNADGSAAKWTDIWYPKCRAIEYGKYINGYTTYNRKKVTLPVCKDKDTLLEVFVSSYGSEPSIWLHDPELTNKMSYLTIAAANNGDIRLYADQINMFTSSIEQGGLNDQNGSPEEPPSYMRVRTKDFMTIKASSDYALTYNSSLSVSATVYVYNSDGEFKYTKGPSVPSPVIFLPTLAQGDKVKVEFMVGPTTSGIQPSFVKYAQLYSLGSEKMSELLQGPLVATGSGAIEIETDSADPDADKFVSTKNYYVAKSTNRLVLYFPGSLPTTIEVNGETKEVFFAQVRMKIFYQNPSDNPATYDLVYDNYYETSETYVEMQFTPPKVNTRFKVQLGIYVGYYDGDNTAYTYAPITPQMIAGITLTELYKQDYYPASNALETYGHIEKRIEFEDAESSQELLERAQKYLRQSQFDEMQLKVKALDVTLMGAEVDNLHVADKINVSSPPHGVYRDFVIREMSIPFDKPENTTFELGWDNKDSLSKLIRKEKSKW